MPAAADLLADINQLLEQRIALDDRLSVVLDSLEEKGGDVELYRKYSSAVSRVEFETADAEAALSGIIGWLTKGVMLRDKLHEQGVIVALAGIVGKKKFK